MKPYKVVSLDMFQTLVNIQGRTGNVWKPILQERFSEERAAELGGLLLSYYYKAATTIRDSGVYWTSKEIYSDSFQKVFQQEAMEYDYLQAVDVLFAEHRLSELYEETEHFCSGSLENIKCVLSAIQMWRCFPIFTRVIQSGCLLQKSTCRIRMTAITGCLTRLLRIME